jgi:hypothetical protein
VAFIDALEGNDAKQLHLRAKFGDGGLSAQL